MGFEIKQEDRVDAVAYVSAYSAKAVLGGLNPEEEHSHITLYSSIHDVYEYGTTYKVTITIEPA